MLSIVQLKFSKRARPGEVTSQALPTSLTSKSEAAVAEDDPGGVEHLEEAELDLAMGKGKEEAVEERTIMADMQDKQHPAPIIRVGAGRRRRQMDRDLLADRAGVAAIAILQLLRYLRLLLRYLRLQMDLRKLKTPSGRSTAARW